MKVFELMNILKNLPAGSSVVLAKFNSRSETLQIYETGPIYLEENGDHSSALDTVKIDIGKEIK